MTIEWKDEYSVGIKQIDDQHQDLVKTIGKLYEAIYARAVQEKLSQIFAELAHYAEAHFKTEEKYFDEFQYEHSEEHKREHDKFRKKIIEIKEKYKNSDMEISFELGDFLEDWLAQHLNSEDRKYIQCFKEHGLE